MLRHPEYTRARLANVAERLRALIYADTRPVDAILMSPRVGRITLEQATALEYRPVALGEQLGPVWSSFWFDVRAHVPEAWAGRRIDLLWSSHSEATLWLDGRSVQGLNCGSLGERIDAILTREAPAGGELRFLVEVACNGMFGSFEPPIDGFGRPYASIEPAVLDRCEIALFDLAAWTLFHDFDVLRQLEAEHAAGLDPALAGRVLAVLNEFCNVWQAHDRESWAVGGELLATLYANRNRGYSHELSAIGHGHLDSAWLWPVAETYRKCVRTFSSQVTYMEDYPEYRFVCSQAQQYAWVKERNPDLYARIGERVRSGQFVPVGGSWVEPDCNIPSGESLVRQFLLGQSFFLAEFGIHCREFWNPDVFGYNGQLPQILRGVGIDWFLTQKLSWNRFNKPAYHTFLWEGIDGSRVLTHFPPADTYSSDASIAELRLSDRAYHDHDRSHVSALLFGYGDGGGGPTKTMLETLRRAADLEGVPRTQQRSSAEFFTALEEDARELPVLVGELYFEYHRGTYTSQAAVKRANRECEFLLRDAELLAALAHWRTGHRYPRGALTDAWKLVCLNQFHDIVSGAGITEVYADALRDYDAIRAGAVAMRAAALDAMRSGEPSEKPLNTLGVRRRAVLDAPDGTPVLVDAPPFGTGCACATDRGVALRRDGDGWLLENEHLRAVIDAGGRLASLEHKGSGRSVLRSEGNVLERYDDVPTEFEAWDVDPFHLETRRDVPPAHESRVVRCSPLRAELAFAHRIGQRSDGTQLIRLDAEGRRLEFHWKVRWSEARTMLKVRFDVEIQSPTATYEMQFGTVARPTHYTTSYDLARYEVPGHRWADLSEHGFGVALLTNCKYGYSVLRGEMRISLLRAPKYPDPTADMGDHEFGYAIYPHVGGWQDGGVVAEALSFNVPLLWTTAAVPSAFAVDSLDLVLDTVKLAEREDAIVLRLYEAHGGRGRANLVANIDYDVALRADLLERPTGALLRRDGSALVVDYRPYEIITILLRREGR